MDMRLRILISVYTVYIWVKNKTIFPTLATILQKAGVQSIFVLSVSLEHLCSMFLALCVFYLKLRILHPGDNRCSMQLYYCKRLNLYQGEKDQFLRTMSLRDTKFPFFKALIFAYCLHLWKPLSNLVWSISIPVCRSDLRLKRHKLKSRIALK